MSNARKLADNLPTEGSLFGRNVLINGGMNVAQRATSASGVGSGFAYPTVDRWKIVPSTSGRASMAQNNESPNGFNNSISLACTTADTSISAGEYFILRQSIEGQDLQRFAKGTSDAKEFTVSFYVKGNASATYIVELEDTDNDRVCSKTFNVTTNWTRVILTFPADTTGAFDDDNARSFNLNIWLHAGSNYTSGTLNSSSFAAKTDANRIAGISSFFDSTSRVFYITGCQMEVGPQSTPFEHEPTSVTLEKCMRYYELFPTMYACHYGSGHSIANLLFRVPKRATPSMTFISNGGGATHGTSNYLGNYIYWANTQAANSAAIVADAEL